MYHYRKDVTDRAGYQRMYAADKSPEDPIVICPVCGERAFYFLDCTYMCKLEGHEHRGGVWVRFGDWPQVKALIVEANQDAEARPYLAGTIRPRLQALAAGGTGGM